MKKLFITFIAGCQLLTVNCFSQQLPQYSQYMFNKLVFNPAITGSEQYVDMRLSHRSQWTGFEGAPSTQTLSVHGPIKEKKFGIGGYLFNDRTGPIRNTGINISYAYHISINDNSKLSLGLSGSVFQSGIDGTKIKLNQKSDNLIDRNSRYSTVVPDAAFGSYFYSDKYYLGFSILHLFKSKTNIILFKNTDYRAAMTLVHHYYLSGGYKIELTEKYYLEPSFLINYLNANPTQLGLGLLFNYDDFIQFGLSYRTNDAIVLVSSLSVIDALQISYSYDILISSLRKQSSGSHEIVLSYRIYYYPNDEKKSRAMFNIGKEE